MRPITILISEPCPANWEDMTPAASGRHCAACQKTVVDFSQKTDTEILAHLAQASRAGVCGRLRPDQVGRALAAEATTPPTGRWRAGLGAFLAALRLALPDAAQAQGPAGPPVALAAPGPHPAPAAAPQPAAGALPLAGSYRVQGVVLDAQTHRPIPGATIMLKGSSSGVGTDEQGKFVLPLATTQTHVTLLISFVGYETVTKELDLRATAEPFSIQLRPDMHMLGGLGLVSPPPTLWQRMARFFA